MKHLDQKDLAISPRTLEQWRWQGRGPQYLKVCGRVVYRLSDIEVFEEAGLNPNTSMSDCRKCIRPRTWPWYALRRSPRASAGAKSPAVGWCVARPMMTVNRACRSAMETTAKCWCSAMQAVIKSRSLRICGRWVCGSERSAPVPARRISPRWQKDGATLFIHTEETLRRRIFCVV